MLWMGQLRCCVPSWRAYLQENPKIGLQHPVTYQYIFALWNFNITVIARIAVVVVGWLGTYDFPLLAKWTGCLNKQDKTKSHKHKFLFWFFFSRLPLSALSLTCFWPALPPPFFFSFCFFCGVASLFESIRRDKYKVSTIDRHIYILYGERKS